MSTRKARKLRSYVLRKRAMKRELAEYLRQSYEAEAKAPKGWTL